ncbi:hypothetical protein Tco_0199742 [Tanacetum coccineum]
MRELEATGEHTTAEINAMVRGGKLRGHIPGVGPVMPGYVRFRLSYTAPVDRSRDVDFMMSLMRSDNRFADAFARYDSGGASGSGGSRARNSKGGEDGDNMGGEDGGDDTILIRSFPSDMSLGNLLPPWHQFLDQKIHGAHFLLGIVAEERFAIELTPSTFLQRHFAGDRFPQRHVADERVGMLLEKASNVVVRELVRHLFEFTELFNFFPGDPRPLIKSVGYTCRHLVVDMGLLDFNQAADPQKVRAVEVEKGADQVKLLESTKDCFMPLVIHAAGGSGSAAGAEVPAPVRNAEEEVAGEQPKKVKRRRLVKQSDVLPAKKLRADHPSLASSTGGKSLANLEQIMSESSRSQVQEELAIPSAASPQGGGNFVDLTDEASLQTRTTAGSSGTLSAPVYTAAVTTVSKPVTASKATAGVNPDLAGLSHPEGSKSSEDSFYEIPEMDSNAAKRCTADMPGFGTFKEKDIERTKILVLKSSLHEKEAKPLKFSVFVIVSSLSGDEISLGLMDAKAACTEVGNKMVSLASKRDRLLSELEAHVSDVFGRLEGEFYPTYLTLLAWLGEASTSAAPLSVEHYCDEDTDETLGSVVCMPKLER